jgi:hypothetical protein
MLLMPRTRVLGLILLVGMVLPGSVFPDGTAYAQEGSYFYEATIYAKDTEDAGTDASVWINLFGENGRTLKWYPDSGRKHADGTLQNTQTDVSVRPPFSTCPSGYVRRGNLCQFDDFERGDHQHYRSPTVPPSTALGARLVKIQIGHDNNNDGPAWNLEKVEVAGFRIGDPGGNSHFNQRFLCSPPLPDCWIGGRGNTPQTAFPLVKELLPEGPGDLPSFQRRPAVENFLADLTVTVSTIQPVVVAGGVIEYFARIQNVGDPVPNSTKVRLMLRFPEQATYIDQGDPRCKFQTPDLTCDFLGSEVNAGLSFSFIMRVPMRLPGDRMITVQAEINPTRSIRESVYSNNKHQLATPVQPAS